MRGRERHYVLHTYNIKNTYHVIPEGMMIKLDLKFALINQ